MILGFHAQAQITVSSGCGITASSTPYNGFPSILQIDLNIPGTYYCGDIMLYYNGVQLKCNEISVSIAMNCQSYNGGFSYNNSNTASTERMYLDTRTIPYSLSSYPPTNNTLSLTQAPQNLVSDGSLVTFTAVPVILDGSSILSTVWYRDGQVITGQSSNILSEIPPHNGAVYYCEVQLSNGTSLQSEEKRVLFVSARDSRFTASGEAQIISTALDECFSIYQIDVTITGNSYYSQFSISEGATQLTSSTLSLNGVPGVTTWNNNNMVYDGGPSGTHFTCYLNTRTGFPYELSGSLPYFDPTYMEVTLTADRTVINAGQSVLLTADVCPAGNYTFEWTENDVFKGGTSSPTNTFTVTPPANGTDYNVIVNGGTKSNTETIFFSGFCDNGRLTTDQWYNRAQIRTFCAMDACQAYFRITLSVQKDAHFALLLDGSPVNAIVDYDVPELRMEMGGDGTPAYRYSGDDAEITIYLDLRNSWGTVIQGRKPDRNIPFALITATGGSQIPRCTPISFTSCTPSAYTTIQWYKNGAAVSGASSGTFTDNAPDAGDTYYAVIDDGLATQVTSNTITVSFQPPQALPGMTLSGYAVQLNAYEHNTRAGSTLVFTVPGMSAITTYTLQYKSLAVGSQWRDTTITPAFTSDNKVIFTLNPEFGAKYRIKGADAGNCNLFYSDSSLVRFIYDCTGGSTFSLFSENFGRFQSGTYYYGTNQSTTTDVHPLNYPAGSYWAADPHNPPRVKNHTFAWEQGGVYGWCPQNGGRRIEDGYYAIVNNPASGDCGNLDYWNGSDHTGNGNGGMLFVNVGGGNVGEVIYEQKIDIAGGCSDVKVLFSAFINNATIKGQTPVDVRLDILNQDKSKTLYSISSGEVLVRTQTTAMQAWANLSFMFDVDPGESYYVQLVNNGESGSGNDILIDDISVTICVPKIDIELTDPSVIEFGNDIDIGVCKDMVTVPLEAKTSLSTGTVTDIFPNPIYQFQYSRDNGTTWKNFSTQGNTINILLDHGANVFRGITQWRIVVAGSQATIDGLGNGTITQPSCSNMYLQSNVITVDFEHYHYDDIIDNWCFGQSYSFAVEIPANGRYQFYNADASGNVIGLPIQSGTWTATNNVATISVTAPTTTTPQYWVFRPISPYGCQFDFLVAITGRDCEDLVLSKTASAAQINAGDTFTYMLTVENKSLFTMGNIVVRDMLPAQMSYRSYSASQGTYTAASGDWEVGALGVGDMATLVITVQNVGGADTYIMNNAFIHRRTKNDQVPNTVIFDTYNDAKDYNTMFVDNVAVYVNPVSAPGILGEQPCKDDVITYSLNTSLIPLTPRAEFKWSILPQNSGFSIQGSSTAETFTVQYYTAPAAYMIICEIIPDNQVLDPPIVQTKDVYVTDVPDVSISGKVNVCYGDIEKYNVLSDNVPNATFSWALQSDEDQLIIDGAYSRTATIEWLRNDGGIITTDQLIVEAINTVDYGSFTKSCANTTALGVFIHQNPPAYFRYDGSSMMYFQNEPAYRLTDSIYTDIPVEFINESHLVGNTTNVQYYWDFAGDGVFSEKNYNATSIYHEPGHYTVQLHAVDTIWGCRTTFSKPLEVEPNPNCIATLPNFFTPAKMDNNKFGALYTNGVVPEGFELRVFSRWGAEVWSTNDPNEYWNGSYKGEPAKQDVYVYHCKATCQDIDPKTQKRKTLSIKGDVTLIR
ncbi:MAG: DUF11 domain-containing protein [Bacteroidales bacterium]|nr:DUF11 domain-containing protein [Bacteroidales bacterium]